MKKNAFTLAEILIVLLIVGVIAVIMYEHFDDVNSSLQEKMSVSKVLKAKDAVHQALTNIKLFDKSSCPMGAFMVNSAGTWEYTLVTGPGGSGLTTDGLVTLLQDYLKFQEVPVDFCDYTSYCSDNTIKGGKIFDDTYIGFKVYGNAIANCPDYYMPGSGDLITGRGKCWGTLYVKLADPYNVDDTLGQDVFIFGLGQDGVAY